MRVEEVAVEATYDLRLRVLRDHMVHPDVVYPQDSRPGAFHLGVRESPGGPLLAVGSFYPEAAAARPGRPAARLRGMAVKPGRQGEGLGALIMWTALARLRSEGVQVLWANARDTALGFYLGHGMDVAGDGFVEMGLPHHVVVLDLL